ncbi:MAG: hypothetical protein EOM54_10805 [Clostridia bacterium]|nr:hypothetical protein [Clostridia bacterium]
MFGYVIANKEIMTEDQVERYKACYCGLCRVLKSRRGSLSRMTLTYDMTFLILLLSSMYEPEEREGRERCIMHPAKSHGYWQNEITDYAADMNLALAYLNFLDDWKDDRKLLKLAEAGLFSEEYFYVSQRYPEKCAFIEERLAELSAIEKENSPDPDVGAKCFGRIMGEVFCYREDAFWGDKLREFGESLGQFVYIMDAVVDFDEDTAAGNYNPMSVLVSAGRTEDDLRYILTMLIGECAGNFERLPLVRDVDIMRNILYSGVWLRYNAKKAKKQAKGGGADERSV